MRKYLLISIILFLALGSKAQTYEPSDPKQKGLAVITEEAVRGPLEFLASPWTEGRETGSRGGFMAADYLVSLLKAYGISPYGQYEQLTNQQVLNKVVPRRTYFQDFNLIESWQSDQQLCSVAFSEGSSVRRVELNYKTDFACGTPEMGFDIDAPVVFVGYGMVDEAKGINELKGLTLKGKIVLRLPGFPGMDDPNSVAAKKFATGVPQKDEILLQKGAIAVMEVASSDEVQSWADNYPVHFKSSVFEGASQPDYLKPRRMRLIGDTLSANLKRFAISKRVANELLKESGVTVDGYKAAAAQWKFPALKNLTGITTHVVVPVKNRIVKARNILGVIEGENKNEFVVVGGHYDHLGIQNGFIYNGADDNASGAIGILTMAKAFQASGIKPKRSIIFAFWTGEEKGLLGSDYFVNQSSFKDQHLAFYLNFDMISRSAPQDTLEKEVRIIYTRAYPAFALLNAANTKAAGIDLKFNYVPMEIPRGGSDFTAFSLKNVPLMTWNAGHPLDYHQLSDEVAKVNWQKMVNIVRLGFMDVFDIVNGNILH